MTNETAIEIATSLWTMGVNGTVYFDPSRGIALPWCLGDAGDTHAYIRRSSPTSEWTLYPGSMMALPRHMREASIIVDRLNGGAA